MIPNYIKVKQLVFRDKPTRNKLKNAILLILFALTAYIGLTVGMFQVNPFNWSKRLKIAPGNLAWFFSWYLIFAIGLTGSGIYLAKTVMDK